MIQVRQNIFETNSSSMHSLTVMMKENYRLWVRGDVLLNEDEDSLPEVCTRQQALEFIAENYGESPDYKYPDSEVQFLNDYGFVSYDYYMDSSNINHVDYTTPGGEEIVILDGERCC